MRIGFLGEDSAHEAVIIGLAQRWCPQAEVVGGKDYYRGHGKRRRRQLRDAVPELLDVEKCDCVVLLVDSDNDTWSEAVKGERGFLLPEYHHAAAIGAPERNIECWLSLDPPDLAAYTGWSEADIRSARKGDPKGVVGAAFQQASEADPVGGVYAVMTVFVAKAPLAYWLEDNSFRAFYERCQEIAQTFGCALPNEMNAKVRLP